MKAANFISPPCNYSEETSMEDSVYFSKCLMSPSCCVPKQEQYSRLPPSSGGAADRSRRPWRKLLRRLLRESNKCIYGSTAVAVHNNSRSSPLTFQYDAVSYSQNFDEGTHHEDYRHFGRFSPVYRTHFR
uniref:Uncharacterized protein n=1 Tax=Opuntia streptacantha TaxID=393608 RepID=A0A7C8YIX7_OPUST